MSSKELLAEYATLATKLRHINETLQEINSLDVVQLIDKIRVVERKMGLVYTLFRSSVYSVLAQDQDQQQQQSPYSQQDEFQGEAQSSSTTTNQGRSSMGLNGSNGESDGYANNNNSNNNNGNHNKDRLLSSTGGRGEEEYDLGGGQSDHERLAPFQSNNAEDDYGARSTHKVAASASSSSLASAPMPQTPSRYRSNHHPYHHYRSDPLLESTYRRTTLAAAHAAAANAASSSSSASASALSRANTSGVMTSQSAAAAGGGAMPQRRTSNVLDQFEAMTGQRSLLSLSRGHGRRPYDNGTSSSSSTNRPRYI
ncbi:hypothetical protein DFQ26_002319 [Actinomortierella ambigua]|nr:hypothetical protein DFQ26_002319 [Actinomortierella ambigua]